MQYLSRFVFESETNCPCVDSLEGKNDGKFFLHIYTYYTAANNNDYNVLLIIGILILNIKTTTNYFSNMFQFKNFFKLLISTKLVIRFFTFSLIRETQVIF